MFAVLVTFVVVLLFAELIGVCSILWATLTVLTAFVYSLYLAVRFAYPVAAVLFHHRPVVGYFAFGALALMALNFVSATIYFGIASHGGRELVEELHTRVLRRVVIIWRRCAPCSRVCGWLGRMIASLCRRCKRFWLRRW